MGKYKLRFKPKVTFKKEKLNQSISKIENVISEAIHYATQKTQESLEKLFEQIVAEADISNSNLLKFIEKSAKSRGIPANKINSALKNIQRDVKRKMIAGIKYKSKNMYFVVGRKDRENVLRFYLPIYFLPFEDIGEAYAAIIQQQGYNLDDIVNKGVSVDLKRLNEAAKKGDVKWKRGPFGIKVPLPDGLYEVRKSVRNSLDALTEISEYAPIILKSSLAAEVYSYLDPTATIGAYFDSFEQSSSEETFEEAELEEMFFNQSAANINSIGKEKLLGQFSTSYRKPSQESKDVKLKFKTPEKKHEQTIVLLEKQILRLEEEIMENKETIRIYLKNIDDIKRTLERVGGETEVLDDDLIDFELQAEDLETAIEEALDVIKQNKAIIREEKNKSGQREEQLKELFDFMVENKVLDVGEINRKIENEIEIMTGLLESKFPHFERRLFKGGSSKEIQITSSKKQQKVLEQETKKAREKAYAYFKENVGEIVRQGLDPIVDVYSKSLSKIKILLAEEFQKQVMLYLKSHGAKIKSSSGKGGEYVISDINRTLKNTLGKNFDKIVSDTSIIFDQVPKKAEEGDDSIVNAVGYENSRKKILADRERTQAAYLNVFKNISSLDKRKIKGTKGVIKRRYLANEAKRMQQEEERKAKEVKNVIAAKKTKNVRIQGETLSEFTKKQNELRELRAYSKFGSTVRFHELMGLPKSDISETTIDRTGQGYIRKSEIVLPSSDKDVQTKLWIDLRKRLLNR